MAEKLQAVIALGIVNSRMKDFYDLYAILRAVEVSEDALLRAIESTFMRRETDIPRKRPTGFSKAFSQDPIRQTQWTTYSAETDVSGMTLKEICDEIWAQLEPVCTKANQD